MLYRLLSCISRTLLTLTICAVPLVAQDPGKTFKSQDFPVTFGPDNIGTEFYFAFPANWLTGSGQEELHLYISSGVETNVDVYTSTGTQKSVKTIANNIVTVTLTPREGQIFVANDQTPLPPDQIYKNQAVRIVADDPIVVYGLNRNDFTTEGFLALPVNALGKEYVVASAEAVIGGTQELPSQYMIIAPYDGTTVTVTNPKRTVSNAEGSRVTVTLNKGDVYSAMSIGNLGDLSGAYVIASKPIAVMGGQQCTYLPDFQEGRNCCCDHLVEMMLPLESWGTFYHAIPIQNRTRGDMYRIYAGEPGAEVFVNGTKIATLSAVGGPEGIGFVEYIEEVRRPIEFTSNKRIAVAQYNNSQRYSGVGGNATDPFYMLLSPVEQYQDGFIFSTPAREFSNYVNIVGDSAAVENAEITEAGADNWRKASTFTGAPYSFPTIIQGKKYVGLNITIPPGAYRIRSTGGLAAYIYGQKSFDSYGYPLSVATSNLILPDVVPPSITRDSACDGSVNGSVTDFPDDRTIRTNLRDIRMDNSESFNYKFERMPFVANESRGTTFTLEVIDPRVDALAILIAQDGAGNVSTDTIRYFARNITITPDPLDFGEVLTGTSPELPVNITNNGSRSVDIKAALLQDGTQGFSIISPTGSFTLDPGESQEAIIRFDATTQGLFSDSIGIEDDCSILWLSLTRAETVKPIIQVSDWNFGPQVINQPPLFHDLQIRNAGTGTLTITGGTGPSDPVFTLPDGLPAFPLELKANQSQPLRVSFRPTVEGTFNDQVVFEHNAPDDPANDPVGIIQGVGIDATLFATPYDWPKKRVGTGKYFATVMIKNLGTADAKIFGVKDKIGDLADFAVDDELNILNVTVPAGGEIPVTVSFTPQDVGNRQMKVIFDTEETDETIDTVVSSLLTGIGVVPGLATNDLDFGPMDLADPEKTLTVDFYLEAPTGIDNAWRDTVWIDGFDFVTDNDGAGNDDFRYELPAGTTFPIVLVPDQGDRITITGYFAAKVAGNRSATLLARTRDGVDTISTWIGRGTVQDAAINAFATPGDSLCLGESDIILVTIESNGPVPLTVNSLVLTDPNGEFTLVNPPATPLVIGPGQTETVEVQFLPVNTNGPRSAVLTITSDDPANPSIDVQLTGLGRSFDITGELLLTGTHDDGNQAVLGEDITATVRVNDLLDGTNATGYKATFTYDPDNLFEPTSVARITLNPLIHPPGTTVTINGASTRGTLILDVKAPAPLTGFGSLLSVPFGVIFNTNLERAVDVDVQFTDGAECSQIVDVVDAIIAVNPLCGLNLRLIELTAAKYTAPVALPNPIAGGTAEIEYGLGLDGHTTITLFDASGNQIATLVDQYQDPGTYRVGFDARTLSSGLYYCKMVSGHKEFVSSIIISE